MNRLEKKFLDQLNEFDEDRMDASEVTRDGDIDALEGARGDDTEIGAFNADPNVLDDLELYVKRAKGWQSKVSVFLDWLNGTGTSLRTELNEIDDKYEGSTKDAEKKIRSIAEDLGSLEQILIEIPREIKSKRKEQTPIPDEGAGFGM